MTITSDTPADTTIMRIVHDASGDVTSPEQAPTWPGPSGQPPSSAWVIGADLTWMMHFLHDHHAAEDNGLYPLLRERVGR